LAAQQIGLALATSPASVVLLTQCYSALETTSIFDNSERFAFFIYFWQRT